MRTVPTSPDETAKCRRSSLPDAWVASPDPAPAVEGLSVSVVSCSTTNFILTGSSLSVAAAGAVGWRRARLPLDTIAVFSFKLQLVVSATRDLHEYLKLVREEAYRQGCVAKN